MKNTQLRTAYATKHLQTEKKIFNPNFNIYVHYFWWSQSEVWVDHDWSLVEKAKIMSSFVQVFSENVIQQYAFYQYALAMNQCSS